MAQLRRRHRPREVITLRFRATCNLQHCNLPRPFNTFSRYFHIHLPRQCGDGADNGVTGRIVRQASHEFAVDLQFGEGHVSQRPKLGVTRSKVIENDTNATFLEFGQGRNAGRTGQHYGFRYLKLKALR